MKKRNFAILALIFVLGLSACSQQTVSIPSAEATSAPAPATQTPSISQQDQTTPSPTTAQATQTAPPSKGKDGPTGTGTFIVEWERTGGIAGICQILQVNQDFSYQIVNCATGKTMVSGDLTSDQAGYVEDLQNRYASFQWNFTPPPGSADMFMDRYTLFGKGAITPPADVQAAINQDLANLAGELMNPSNPTPAS
jgi:hypothetical protein